MNHSGTFFVWLPSIIVTGLIILLCILSSNSQSKNNKRSKWRTEVGKPVLGFLFIILVFFVYIALQKGGFFILICIGLLGFLLFTLVDESLFTGKDREDKRNEFEEKRKRRKEYIAKKNLAYEESKRQLLKTYGTNCTHDIVIGDVSDIREHVFIYENVSKIIIYGKHYDFNELLGFTLVDNSTSTIITTSTGDNTTSTGSIIGRSIVGGVIGGGFGALAGAATAKKNTFSQATSTVKTTHAYTIYLNINSLNEPVIPINLGTKQNEAHQLAGILNIIIERNK